MLQNPTAAAAAAASAEKKKRKEEKKARKLSAAAAAAAPDLDVVANGGGGKTGGKARKLLLRSICSFLESSGFEKTLAVFRSEAEILIDGEKASVLNLEDLFCKFLESSRGSEDATTDQPKELDMKNSVPAEDAHVKKNDKKKKSKHILNPDEENLEEGSHGKTNTDREHDLLENDVNDKEKRKKKSKMSGDPSDGKPEIGENGDFRELVEKKVEELKTLSATPAADSNPKPSGEKRKKTKRSSDASAGNAVELETEAFQEGIKKNLKESVTVETSIKDVMVNADSKSKDKKKKKKKDKTKTEDGETCHDAGDGEETASIKDVSEEIINNSKKSKKRKHLASEERASEPENVVEAKDSKHARLEGAEDTTVSKKQKKEKNYENSSETVKTSYNENIDLLTEHKENPGSCDSPKQSKEHLLANGDLEKENEGGTSSKMLKKEKHSAEPTTNSFRRVKLEEVEFVDERLQNNSYWAKGGADSGYGAKAQEILGQVKGRDFRHEKTKKKRGSYRGGQIDLESHSIKFNYSDEE